MLQNFIGIEIKDDTLLVELLSKNDNGPGLADKIMTFLKSNPAYLKLNKDGRVQIKALGKDNKCYLLINSEKLLQTFGQISKSCIQLNKEKAQDSNTSHQIKLSIKSLNSCDYVRKLLDNQGGMRAAFDSLNLEFSFQKTRLVQKVLERIFTEMQLQPVLGPIKSFNNLNLSLTFSSASEMDNYEKIRVFGKVVNKIETHVFATLKGEIKDEVKFNYFSPVFSFMGKLVAQEAQTLLEALFEEPNKEQ